MCITFLYTNSSDSSFKYKLILINNRDEFYRRKTLDASVKTDDDGLIKIYGTDVETEVLGTWLAISKRSDVIRIGNLLNVPGECLNVKKTDLKGRGPIALNFISSNDTIEVHNEKLCNVCMSYNSFNFLSVEITSSDIKTYFTSNSTQSVVKLNDNFIGASNSPVDTPLKKVIEGKKRFQKIIENSRNKSEKDLIEELINLLKWEDKHYPDEELLRRRGNDAELFSSVHVKGNDFYGTRTRTIIFVDQDNNIDYIEETMMNDDPKNAKWKTSRFTVNKDVVVEH
ncbi:hypothetical protein PVAND_013159 [Polypedilum vanderplanki]|uniref:Uncharacterized protein n=1 Tax=Polypedilum vanderplanki TaxID=319348 RepID=A0A9J6CPS9_POLVA|nr:hypothetical protein PVAND_013159 [Polypedilum vanderplanki]